MLKKLILIAVIFSGLVACKSKSAFKFSQDIVTKERSLSPHIQETENKVGRFLGANEYDSIVVAAENMEKMVQEKIDEINDMKVPSAKKADEFKSATLRYFKYIKSLYTGYKDLGKAATEETRQEVIAELQKLVEEKPDVLKNMQKAQGEFAEANGFKVEKQ